MIIEKEIINKKLKNISDLENMNLILLDEELNIDNKIDYYLKKKGLTPGDLSKMTGISRQNISSVMKGKMKPGIDFVLKVSYVLNIRVEDLFSLRKNAWIKAVKTNDESTLYIDMVQLEVIDGKEKKQRVKDTGIEYFNLLSNESLTQEQYNELLDNEISLKLNKTKVEVLRENDKIVEKRAEALAKEAIKKEFDKTHIKLYRKLAQKVEPLVNP